ncbi:MAG: hypothetical protein E7517_05035 [Ruminococcaceae bacterium]|nr:hypothetical protein [Oscillospiraceae bacterium]
MAEKKNRSFLRKAAIFTALIAVYLIVAIPFKVMEVIPGFTDIRPVSMLMPVYGIFFGIPGCIAYAIGNLITDIISDSLRWSCIAGFAANFAGPFCYWLFWARLSKQSFTLRNHKNLLKHILLILVDALLVAGMITPFVVLSYPDVDAKLFFVMVLINSTAFPILIGIPLIILLQDELGLKPIYLPRKDKQITRHKT